MFKWLINLYHMRQRSIDLEILWPICKEKAEDLNKARAAFMYHAVNDIAYSDMSEAELIEYISKLN